MAMSIHDKSPPTPTLDDSGRSTDGCSSKPGSLTPDVRRKRVSHRKSRTGCFACKQRHEKCDEEKPICRRCRDRGRTCTWPPPKAPRNFRGFKVATTRSLRMNDALDAGEAHMLEFFNARTLPILRACHPSILWRTTVGYLSQTSSAFRRILIAVSSQQWLIERTRASTVSPLDAEMVEHFNTRAIRSLRQSIAVRPTEDAPIMAFGCLLLTILASLRGANDDMIVHLRCGFGIISQMQRDCKLTEETRQIFTLLQSYGVTSWLWSLSRSRTVEQAAYLQALPMDINTVEELRTPDNFLLELRGLIARRVCPPDDAQSADLCGHGYSYVNEMFFIQSRYETLRRQVALVQGPEGGISPALEFIRAGLLVLSAHFPSSSAHGFHPPPLETVTPFDAILDHVENIIIAINTLTGTEPSSSPTFSIGIDIILLIDFVLDNSRDVRHHFRALQLLPRCPQREGMWSVEGTTRAWAHCIVSPPVAT